MSYTGVASRLADAEEPAHEAGVMVGRSVATGLDVASYAGLVGCAMTLGADTAVGAARWVGDEEFMGSVAALEDDLTARLTRITSYTATVQAALVTARTVSGKAKAADCLTALNILAVASASLTHARRRLGAVPGQLGTRYEAVYALVAAGRVLPYNGRWLTGTGE